MVDAPEIAKLHDELTAGFRPHINEADQNLMAVLRRSLEFAEIHAGAREIIVNREAFLLAVIAVGSEAAPGLASNTTNWFTDWLKSRIEPPLLKMRLAAARTPVEELGAAQSLGFSVRPSSSIRRVLPAAAKYADTTMGRRQASLRHLFAAVATDPNHHLEIGSLGWSLTEDERPRLISHLQAQIGRTPGPNEKLEEWPAILSQIRARPEGEDERTASAGTTAAKAPVPDPAPALLLSGFSADRTTEQDTDPLETEADVLAMARLICHEDADPPISIGVFGGWGSGKSTFMESLQRQVAALTGPRAAAAQPEGGPRFVSPVVQIRFNAWQFADADLWASLTAEFFDQLRAGGFEGGGKKIHARLIEDVNEHVRGLSKEAAARRAAVAVANDRLREAQFDHDRALSEKDAGIRQALVIGLAEAYESNKVALARYGLVDPDSVKKLEQFIAVAKDARTQAGQLKHLGTTLFAQWPLLLAVLVGALSIGFAIKALAPGQPVAATLGGIATAAAGLLPLARRGLLVMHAVVRQVGPFADKIGEAEEQGLKDVLATEMALRAAAEESEALRSVSERADRALARYVDPTARSNPPRVLRYLLEDDPNTKAFEKEIGLIGRARRLFQALDQIVADNRTKTERLQDLQSLPLAELDDAKWSERERLSAEVDSEIPNRIILYIDDLDRCTHDQVYKVLQAVHLLLAFQLFVVIVAVDVEWVEAAVAKNLEFTSAETKSGTGQAQDRRARAIEYLAKIFQLPFWLKPFSNEEGDRRYATYVGTIAGKVVQKTRRPPPTPAEHGSTGLDEVADPTREIDPITPEPTAVAEGSASSDTAGIAETSAEAVQRALATLQLDPKEVAFLASAAVAEIAAKDPRGVKRLVNVYKIARARLSETDDGMILGDSVRAPAYPLIALCAAIETGQKLETANSFYTEIKRIADNPDGPALVAADLIKTAIAAAITERNGQVIPAKEVLNVARVVRRYSFNRYD